MDRINIRGTVVGTTIAALGLGAGIGGVTYAASSAGSDPVIEACMNVRSGDLRMPTKSSPCATDAVRRKDRERVVSWNEQGIQGDAGAAGPAGEPGPAGPTGRQGSKGDQGDSGVVDVIHDEAFLLAPVGISESGPMVPIVVDLDRDTTVVVTVEVGFNAVADGTLHCDLRDDDQPLTGRSTSVLASEPTVAQSFSRALDLPAGTHALSLNCGAAGPARVGDVNYASIIATVYAVPDQ